MIELECKNLCVGYDGRAVAENINFCAQTGDYLYIVGENGAGKSTLMKTILGLLKPVGGEIKFGDLLKQTDVGYIPQQTEAQKDFPASVYEVVLSGCVSRGKFSPFYSKKQKETAINNMKLLGIDGIIKKSYRELSGGQQQRVLLARALCAAKRILLLDEPVAGLDPIVTRELYDVIKRLNEEQKMTIIMISHDMEAAVKYASHVLFVANPCFFGSADEFSKSEFCKKSVGAAVALAKTARNTAANA